MIFSLAGEKKDHIVLVHQYRYPIAGYVYELPAGLIEKNEGDHPDRRSGCGKDRVHTGICRGPGDPGLVNSPTFTILQVYEDGRLPLYHFDVYRIGDSEEMLEVGWDEYVSGDGVCLVEWADLIEDLIDELPPEIVTGVKIEKDLRKGFDYRRITVS